MYIKKKKKKSARCTLQPGLCLVAAWCLFILQHSPEDFRMSFSSKTITEFSEWLRCNNFSDQVIDTLKGIPSISNNYIIMHKLWSVVNS